MVSLISTLFSLIGMLLSGLFFIANKLRLTIPLVYFLLIITILNPWAGKNETLAWIILIALISVSLISWIITGIKYIMQVKADRDYENHFVGDLRWQISRAREMGYSDQDIAIDKEGKLIVKSTGKPIIY